MFKHFNVDGFSMFSFEFVLKKCTS